MVQNPYNATISDWLSGMRVDKSLSQSPGLPLKECGLWERGTRLIQMQNHLEPTILLVCARDP